MASNKKSDACMEKGPCLDMDKGLNGMPEIQRVFKELLAPYYIWGELCFLKLDCKRNTAVLTLAVLDGLAVVKFLSVLKEKMGIPVSAVEFRPGVWRIMFEPPGVRDKA